MSDALQALIDAGDGLPADLFDSFRRPAWHALAACRDQPLALFFPEKGERTAPAKAICARCTVITECHTAALEHREIGIWAGTTTGQRRVI